MPDHTLEIGANDDIVGIYGRSLDERSLRAANYRELYPL